MSQGLKPSCHQVAILSFKSRRQRCTSSGTISLGLYPNSDLRISNCRPTTLVLPHRHARRLRHPVYVSLDITSASTTFSLTASIQYGILSERLQLSLILRRNLLSGLLAHRTRVLYGMRPRCEWQVLDRTFFLSGYSYHRKQSPCGMIILRRNLLPGPQPIERKAHTPQGPCA